MRGINGLVVAWVMVLSMLTATPAAAAGESDHSARATVERAVQQTVVTLRDASMPRPERGQKVGEILQAHFDFETFSRLAVGPSAWRKASEAQRAEFVREFSKHVLAISRGGTNQYGGQDLTIAEDRAENRGDWTVKTRVIGKKNGTPREVATIDFRLRQREQEWKVIDVTISGISMAATFRAQFATILKDGGMQRAIEILREKNAAADAVAGRNQP